MSGRRVVKGTCVKGSDSGFCNGAKDECGAGRGLLGTSKCGTGMKSRRRRRRGALWRVILQATQRGGYCVVEDNSIGSIRDQVSEASGTRLPKSEKRETGGVSGTRMPATSVSNWTGYGRGEHS